MDGSFAAGDAFQDSDAFLLRLEAFGVDKIGRWPSMLRDEDRSLRPSDLGDQSSRLSFERGNKFGLHHSDTIVIHCLRVKLQPWARNLSRAPRRSKDFKENSPESGATASLSVPPAAGGGAWASDDAEYLANYYKLRLVAGSATK